MLDPRQNDWMEIAPMQQKRDSHVLVNYKERLFAMQGFGGLELGSLSTVEEYDPRANQWSFVESLKSEQVMFAAVTLLDRVVILIM